MEKMLCSSIDYYSISELSCVCVSISLESFVENWWKIVFPLIAMHVCEALNCSDLLVFTNKRRKHQTQQRENITKPTQQGFLLYMNPFVKRGMRSWSDCEATSSLDNEAKKAKR